MERWKKLAVVMAPLEPDAAVATVARRFDITRQQVYDWRRAARRGDLGMLAGVVGFVEVVAETLAHAVAIETEAAPIARLTESATTTVMTAPV